MKYFITIILLFMVTSGCSNINLNNSTKLHIESLNKDPVKFVVIGDSKVDFQLYWDMIEEVSNNGEIDFIIHTGDFTDWSWPWEYKQYKNKLLSITKEPKFIHCIGNHDYRLHGSRSFRKMFGSWSFSLKCNGWTFVFLRNTYFLNYGLVEKDAQILYNILEDKNVKNVAVFMHVPPYGVFKNHVPAKKLLNDKRYNKALKNEKIKLCFYGHYHAYVSTFYNGCLHTITGGAAPNLYKCEDNPPYVMSVNHYVKVTLYKNGSYETSVMRRK